MRNVCAFLVVVLIGLVAVPAAGVRLHAAITAEERAALIALYNAANGDLWYDNSGWKDPPLEADGFSQIGSEATWYGINVTDDHVTGIYLWGNKLSGSITPEIGNLTHLRGLYLSGNALIAIPPELGNLVNLQEIILAGNFLAKIPPELGKLANLQRLNLSDNSLTALPAEIGNLTELQELRIENNALTAIPPELGKLKHLQRLELPGNALTALPPEVGNLTALQELYLYANALAAVPPELGNLTALYSLSLEDNALTNIPAELGGLVNLQNLYLSNNTLTVIPPELGGLTNLKSLFLSHNFLTQIPPELGNLTRLHFLELNHNSLTSIPPELGNLTNLWRLDLDNNSLTRIPPELGNLANLEGLHLSYNALTSIPPELGNLTNLWWLGLHHNSLSTIPPQLGNLIDLQELSLDFNALTDLPTELKNLDSLWLLTLSHNALSSIPPQLGENAQLQELHLEHNALTSLPVELANMANLTYLYLDANKLTGNISTIYPVLNHVIETNYGFVDIGYNGLYSNDPGIRNWLNAFITGWEKTQTIAPDNLSATAISSSSVWLTWDPIKYTSGTGGYMIYYSTTPGGPRVLSGITSGKTAFNYEVKGLQPGTTYYFVLRTRTEPYVNNTNLLISEPGQEVSAATFPVSPGHDEAPFGSLDLPVQGGAPLSGSIAVSGWALDDTGVESVNIYCFAGNNNKEIYIGDAVFVEGARPDVQQAYPGYPDNHRAGWGYMMLTHFLPNGGNGTYIVRAVAVDGDGNQTTLGIKTIVCDNANAVKPFGAVDTPEQGGTVQGSNFVNFGWVLTPQPNTIPPDGSTITVWVDGAALGHPVYNQYRADIANLFSGHNNSNGAVGYFYLDTTAYANGVHTIQWTAADDAGNTDGIGSRYFTIQNAVESRAQNEMPGDGPPRPPISGGTIPVDYSSPVRIKKGFNRNIEPQTLYPGENGRIHIEIGVLERIEIHLFEPGRLAVNLSPLPIGSTFDRQRGVFSWQPGPGFIGEYRFIFAETGKDGMKNKKDIAVNIIPGFRDNHLTKSLLKKSPGKAGE